MADRNKDLVGRLADLSEEAIQRRADAPGAERALQTLKGLGDRVNELQRRTRGFEELEQRLSALEKRVDTLAKAKARPASRSRTRARTTQSRSAPKKS
jgi:DNA repair exonuclease SbcCD ATPase subunit